MVLVSVSPPELRRTQLQLRVAALWFSSFISQLPVGSTRDVREDTADVLGGSRNLKWDRWFPG